MVPQISRRTQSWKQSLLHLDGWKTKRKNTHRRLNVTCESDSHLLSSFNRSKSRIEKFPRFPWWKVTLLVIFVELCLTSAPFQIKHPKITHVVVIRLVQRMADFGVLKDGKRLIQHDFHRLKKTFSREWHCIAVRVLRRSPMNFLYWGWEPLTFIVTVIWWIQSAFVVEYAETHGGTELNIIWKSNIKGASWSLTHSLYCRTILAPSSGLGKRFLLTVNLERDFWTSNSIPLSWSMLRASTWLWIGILKSTTFLGNASTYRPLSW